MTGIPPRTDLLEQRVHQLERLVLFMSKFISVNEAEAGPYGRELSGVIEDLKARHPDV